MGEREDEVLATLADLRAVGVDIVTVGQYLRPSRRHLPVARCWTPEEFEALRRAGMALGFAHVQASPLTRSSYHAREAAEAVDPRRRRRRPRRPSRSVARRRSAAAGAERLMERLGAAARRWRRQRMTRVRAAHGRARRGRRCCCPTGPTCPG